jgi:hypothetical protein
MKSLRQFFKKLISTSQGKMALCGVALLAAGISLGIFAHVTAERAPQPHTKKVAAAQQTPAPTQTTTAPAQTPTAEPASAPPATTSAPATTPKPVQPKATTQKPAPAPVPTTPSINLTAAAYNSPQMSSHMMFRTSNLVGRSYAVLIRKVVGSPRSDIFSTSTISMVPSYGPGSTNEGGSFLLPSDVEFQTVSGDEFDVVVCENLGGSCGLKSNTMRVVVHAEAGVGGPIGFKYEFRR